MSATRTPKPPAFQFYPGDWIASQRVALMSLEDEGAYVRALCYCWQHGSIPADPVLLARLIGKGASTTVAASVAAMFEKHPSDPALLIHDRLDAEREKQREWREKSAQGGRKSAEVRRSAREAQATLQPSSTIGPKQTATLLSPAFDLRSAIDPIQGAATAAPSPADGQFESVWKDYPKKSGKQEAKPQILAAIRAKGFVAILEAVRAYAAAVALWPEAERCYVPDPARWFKRGHYEDDRSTWARKSSGAAVKSLPLMR